jgi:hypothetical protein
MSDSRLQFLISSIAESRTVVSHLVHCGKPNARNWYFFFWSIQPLILISSGFLAYDHVKAKIFSMKESRELIYRKLREDGKIN